jgi:hypothetical protein
MVVGLISIGILMLFLAKNNAKKVVAQQHKRAAMKVHWESKRFKMIIPISCTICKCNRPALVLCSLAHQ